MKRAVLALALIGLFAGQTVMAQQLCAGAQGSSTACASPCSNTVVNDDTSPGNASNGKFNVGGGNQGDGNDGFNNIGNFNIGSANQGNCVINSGQQGGGSCDPSNNAGQIVLRFCQVYPNDNKCQPSGYLAEYTQALIAQIPGVIAQCNGGAPAPPVPATSSVASPPPPTASPPPATASPPPAPVVPTPTTAPGPIQSSPPVPMVLPPGFIPYQQGSSSSSSLVELLELFEEHIAQEKALGRKLKL